METVAIYVKKRRTQSESSPHLDERDSDRKSAPESIELKNGETIFKLRGLTRDELIAALEDADLEIIDIKEL